MAREKTVLDLQAELPEVRSTDFNLFYKPDVAPRDKSIDVFTQSLDNFINGAGTGLALRAEQEEKDINEAEAVAQFNKNRTGFNKAVERGEIPKEANPYFQEKYKELTLNKKAREFKAEMYRRYADPENNVLENPDPNAFDKFYNDALKEFVEQNQLGVFDPLLLEKGFFSETSKTRNSLFNTHVQSQMSKIGEDYRLGFKENIQGLFDKNKSNEEMGADISGFIQDAVTNGLGKSNARKYLLESLKEYAETTADLEFAERLLRDLPSHLKLGTDTLDKVKGLENDFDAIKEIIDDRVSDDEDDKIKERKNRETLEKFEASDFADKYETLSEAKSDPRWNDFSLDVKDKIIDEFKSRKVGFGQSTDPRIDEEVNKLLKKSDYDGALEYLKNNTIDMQQSYYQKKKKEIQEFKFTEKDGLLANEYYTFFKKRIEGIADRANRSGKFDADDISPFQAEKFEASLRKWLSSNPVENFKNDDEREKAFNKEVKERYDLIKDLSLSAGFSFNDGDVSTETNEDGTPTIKGGEQSKIRAKKKDLKQKEPEVKRPTKTNRGGANPENRADDPELKIDLAKVNVIPSGLSRGERAKFLRENENTISQEDFDRIFKKQNDIKLAKGN
jgi:hypothetical protein